MKERKKNRGKAFFLDLAYLINKQNTSTKKPIYFPVLATIPTFDYAKTELMIACLITKAAQGRVVEIPNIGHTNEKAIFYS